ncbi:bifunctional histidinol-phosphatase/imidazoleglycerol-phosphate dehydratase HisB [Parapedobacter sp. ISTM3]|uniref:Histidine biosynthesis bifunctional protein HisB n=1 Tax=Parapedobacter luteus TaxID=623280 RepID=A0A1T5DPN6_9SPHI|nr:MULTISPECIES: bifunctional histidinol-phosphatase/imidazoleglycerol-phosphate dehydratase HisB [Parapedobacter]MBK1440902.1 bifunctional histidinol-phosphatase/imidazoleglycerol-phosphate dehydratase HisB [Parapedobacter sp. ISTM3]SKB73635.1 imidazoleglycerol-phosphate dehydratase [Parapedobacter luteus]
MPDTIKRLLFIDRDGTLILEPEDEQVDSFSKLKFYPGALQYLPRIASELDFELVLVTNQDGLGTNAHPEEHFWPVHHFVIDTFAGEGVVFTAQHIDRTFPHENAPTRKPGTALLTAYFDKDRYDLAHSYVIGDRVNDVKLAQNLGSKAIWLRNNDTLGAAEAHQIDESVVALETADWKAIYEFLKLGARIGEHRRKTNETDIYIKLNLDGKGKADIYTGLPFFDHMLDQIARHGQIDLTVRAKGDLHIDEHHTIEDTGIALGEIFAETLGDKRGIERYAFTLPMDDCLAQVAIDFGGRNWIVWDAEFKREKIGDMPTEMFFHFFKSFSDAAKCNLNIKAEGENEHHKIEAIFKAFAKSIKKAVRRDAEHMELPSTKGVL